jgi:hypothetical protein
LTLAADRQRPWWRIELEYGGRAPRSDELLTPWLFAVPERDIPTRPTPSLDRESTWRTAAQLQRRLLGIDLAAEIALRWLRDGIVWRPLAGTDGVGAWANAGNYATQTATLKGQRGLRFLGWLRLRAALAWRGYSEVEVSTAGQPPPFDARLQILWENHFFQEDGILQLGYQLNYRKAMTDPWSFDSDYDLPSLTAQDLLVGFRLLGANLSLAVVNLTDTRAQMSAGAYSHGRELHWRLHWTFYH